MDKSLKDQLLGIYDTYSKSMMITEARKFYIDNKDHKDFQPIIKYQNDGTPPNCPFGDFMQIKDRDSVFYCKNECLKRFMIKSGKRFYGFSLVLNFALPYLEFYPVERQAAAGMSVLHLLLIPDDPIMNVVTMDAEFIVILQEMVKIANNWVIDNMELPLEILRKQVHTNVNESTLTIQIKGELNERIERETHQMCDGKVELMTCVHLLGKASIGQLHVHMCYGPRTSHLHDAKNIDFSDVVTGIYKYIANEDVLTIIQKDN